MEKLSNPIQELFSNIKKILEFMEIKDKNLASQNENEESRDLAEVWMAALIEDDNYITYRKWWDIGMFQKVTPNVKWNDFNLWYKNPGRVPVIYREALRVEGRKIFLSIYEEKNNYYRMLSGLPPYESTKEDFIFISDKTKRELEIETDLPVHELSILLQNKYLTTKEYQEVLKNNPDKKYLKYLGHLKIDIYNARKAYDFELIRTLSSDRTSINPNLLKTFVNVYSSYREYMMTALYNSQLEDIFKGYRDFMKILLLSWTIMQICTKAAEAAPSKKYLDDAALHIVLSMYGIPRSLLMTQEIRRSLVANLLKLTQNKGRDEVYYDIVKLLGYSDIIISKLMLMRGQEFDDNGNTIMEDNSIKSTLYFLKVDLKANDVYSKLTDKGLEKYEYHKIIDKDNTWWDLDDTRKKLKESSYSMAESKYIEIDAVIHQVRYLFEAIFFTRMIMENKRQVENFYITIPELFGNDKISIYDIMIFCVVAACLSNDLTGEIVTEKDGLIATPGFNFKMDVDLVLAYLSTTKFIEKDKVILFLENIIINDTSDIGRVFYEVLQPMRDWLEFKITRAENRREFLEYETLYRMLFTFDAAHTVDWFEFEFPMEIIRKKYELTNDDIIAYQHYYPRNYDGSVMDYPSYLISRYNPFEDRFHRSVYWNIDIPYKGRLYFHDILNCKDLRYLKTDRGDYFFLDADLKPDRDAIRDAINLINGIDYNELHNATFKATTKVIGTDKEFEGASLLPASIRTGIHKSILIDKIKLDMDGLANPPATYKDYLYRRNRKLYDTLFKNDKFHTNREAWNNDIMTVVLALENELNMHLKYFELSVGGHSAFFKPLTTLINRFKSTLIQIIKTGIKYTIDDKVDAGGNSNMLRLFDEMSSNINMKLKDKDFGLYDAFNSMKHKIHINGRKNDILTGALCLSDEIKVFKNGKDLDKAEWRPGEANSGRWESDEDIIMRARKESYKVPHVSIDTEYWKNLVESLN